MMAGRAAERYGDARDDHRDRGERGQARTETVGPTRRPVAGHRGVPRGGIRLGCAIRLRSGIGLLGLVGLGG